MAEQIPPQVQNQLMRFQELQEQLNNLVLRKRQFELESKEIDRTLNESKNLADDAVVYKSVGVLLFKSEKAKVVAELTEKKEETDLRVKTIEKQELRMKAQLEELRKTIMDHVNPNKGPVSGS